MNLFSNLYRLPMLMVGILLLSLFSACSSDEEWAGTSAPEKYINLTFFVSGSSTVTRAPLGGEDGDGREAGFLRENEVTGITLILYKGTGPADPTATVDFIKYYGVTEAYLEGRDGQGTFYDYSAATTYRSEARYTTGERKIEDGELDFNETYHVLIVANKDVTALCPIGKSISEVINLTTNDKIYEDGAPLTPWSAKTFLMTSERDATIKFGEMSPTLKRSENRLVYDVLQPLLIERMTARVDFNTKGSVYNDDPAVRGFVYNVDGGIDKFVLTKITPFNLFSGDEYLFKRVTTTWPSGTIAYLGDETKTNYVVDPRTADKDNVVDLTSYYQNPLDDFKTNPSATHGITMAVAHENTFPDNQGYANFIVAYPRENTLQPTSHLKKYATGIAIEGNYYVNGDLTSTPTKYVFYTYLRHQGENPSGIYDAMVYEDLPDDATGSGTPMNFGIVRNNIYEVIINKISPKAVDLFIKVKMWDPYLHAYIYM